MFLQENGHLIETFRGDVMREKEKYSLMQSMAAAMDGIKLYFATSGM